MKKLLLALALAMEFTAPAQAQPRMSDAQIKSALIGYWTTARHAYKFEPTGIIRMCPTTGPNPATTTSTWSVKNGVFYYDGHPYKVLTVNDRQFAYQEISGPYAGTVLIFYRISRKEAERY